MEDYLKKNFDVEAKRPSEEALMRWRSAVRVVKNPRRRFRMVADLAKRAEAERKRKNLQEKLRVALYVQKAALHFIDAGTRQIEYKLSNDVLLAGYHIEPDELESIIRSHNTKALQSHGGVEGLAREVSVSLTNGVLSKEITKRQNVYGFNRYAEKPSRSFWMFVWESLHDLTLIILMICSAVSIGVGIATEGLPDGMYDGLGIVLSIFLVVIVTAVSDYKQSLQFKALDKEKKNIIVQVTRDGARQKISIYDLVVGDIVHLFIGDQVPADGLLISGYNLTIDESSLSGETEPVSVNQSRPFLLSGTKVQDGSGKILVTGVGMRTEWGRLMVTLSEGGEDETPLQSIFQNSGSEVVKDKNGKINILGTPTERALLEFGLLLGGDSKVHRQESAIVKVEPFNSEKKKMSVLVSLPNKGGFRAFCKGASEIVLKMCDKIINADGNAVPISEEQRKKITDVINSFAREALRTLCLAFQDIEGIANTENIPADNYILIAVVGIKDPVRPGVKEAVETCLAAGITVRMVTGDNIHTAKAIAKECGILTDDGLAIDGPDFRSKTPQEMRELVPKLQVMARSSPTDKHTLVTQLRNVFKEVVAVTGDGTNDAPALHEADIGLAMGIAGTEVAKENADVIIMDDNFTTIVNVARWGRSVYINIQKFVQFQLTVNIVALMVNFVSACITGSAPLTAVQLLWVNMIMDTLGALALATEPPNDGLMKRPPIGRNVNFITLTMWRNIIGQSIYQIAVLGVLTFYGKRILKLTGPDSTSVLNTFIFNSFVFCQVFNEISSRDMERMNVFRGIFDSWVFLAVMVCTVVFQIIIVEVLGTFAATVPLNWKLWAASIIIGAVSMPVAVFLKCIPVEKRKLAANAKQHDGYDPLPSGPDLA
ncbi:Calcium-transporting ATPase [Melia azedarach]|uniref:Calcium-transporting ATPase n=1 Tax=Melia azedarach TaxID=155640 RepID=A0ACC1XJG4_MELAZ|nr:Calcium-transporting ATPase [Melia azedarach]